MSAATNLKRRGAVYYCRRRIPHDLIQHYDGRTELAVSLRTKSLPEARRRANDQWLQWETEFDRIRAGRGVSELSAELIEGLAAQWVADVLAEDEESRIVGGMRTRTILEENTRDLQELEAVYRMSLARGVFLLIERRADDALREAGIKLDKKSDSYRRLCYRLLKAGVGLFGSLQARNRGDVVDTPHAPAAILVTTQTNRKGNGVGLVGVLDKWAAEREPTPRARQEWGLVVRRFNALHGDLPVDLIEKRHVVTYKDQMVDKGAAAATISKHLGAIASLLQLATDDGLCAVNVARGIKVRGRKVPEEARLPYDTIDLQRIFSSPVYTEAYRPLGGGGEAAYWLPLLGLFTGARLEELGQARVVDVKEAEGIHFLDISDAGEGKSVKTASSRRRVPIHPELERLGFLDYVEERKRAKDARLFPILKQNSYGRWTPNWSKWWGHYVRGKAKIVDPRKVFHSFRHGFKDACRACGIHEEISDALTGHSGGGVGRTYGGQYPLKPLAKAIKELHYHGLDLRSLRQALGASAWVQP